MSDERQERKNGWERYQELVLTKLNDHGLKLQCMDEKLVKVMVSVGALKVKAGVWGVIGGAIPILIMIVIYMIREVRMK